MALSTTIVIVLAGLAVLFGAVSKFDATKSYFSLIGMSDLATEPVSRRMVAGTLASIFGGMIAAVWIWAIQRQEVIGQTSLCAAGSGCVKALSDNSMNTLPFTDLGYGLFYVLLFSMLLFLALSVHLESNWSNNGNFLSWGRIGSLIGSLFALVMLIFHLAMVDDSPALCPLCLILVAANFVTLFLFHQLFNLHSDGTWSSKNN